MSRLPTLRLEALDTISSRTTTWMPSSFHMRSWDSPLSCGYAINVPFLPRKAIIPTSSLISQNPQGNSIPAVGSSRIWEYYTGGFRFLIDAPAMVKEGSTRYPGRVFRPAVSQNPYHHGVIRSSLTRNLGKCFPDIHDERDRAFNETLSLYGTDWRLVPILPTILTVITRTSTRLFVGPQICRDPDYLELALQYTIDIVIRSQIINLLASVLRPILGPLISSRNQNIRKGMKHLAPTIQYRIAQENEFGPSWPGKPNDLISWLLDSAEGRERTAPALVVRILLMNMAAIHSSSSVFTHALFDLTNHPEEAEQVVAELGWTKAAVNRMHKIDSFLRESQRIHDNGPGVFNRHMISTGVEHLPFGHKLHACPGRFFAATALKTMLAHVVINYDVRAEVEGLRPPDDVFGISVIPNRKAKIWFKKRQ
ncbi:cytochrome P450 [Mycena maculata]|uniref:Cytochrome P450 n=1 Tax=Mycena maculata TaxID=230809 RepID=A0AAD7MWL6_9AGAR|nr:cytochrome P450 [Mycena maculata]